MIKSYRWDPEKNDLLKSTRGFGFEDVISALEAGHLLDELNHPSPQYSHQRIYMVHLDGYAIVVPFIEAEDHKFLKTAYASRKFTKAYLKEVPQ